MKIKLVISTLRLRTFTTVALCQEVRYKMMEMHREK